MASITDQNWVVWNQGKNPLVSFNFMLRVEMAYDLPCKSVRAFTRELEYDYIQEGGLNDYVHMRRKPITKPFTLEVERYVGVDYVDPLPLGADLALPVLLFVSRSHDQFIPGVVARTYMFTGCTVMKKTYGDLAADRPGLLVETTTLGYREMLCVDIPWSEAGDGISASTVSNPGRNVSGEDRRAVDMKVLAQELFEKAKAERDQADAAFDPGAVLTLMGELEAAAGALRSASKAPGGMLDTRLTQAEARRKEAEAAAGEALDASRVESGRSRDAERAWQARRAAWNEQEAGAAQAEQAAAEAERAVTRAQDALKREQAARSAAESRKTDAEAAVERSQADAEREAEKLAGLQASAEEAQAAVQKAGETLEEAAARRNAADTARAEAEQAARQAAAELRDQEDEEARQRAEQADLRAREAGNAAGEARDRERSAQRELEDLQRQEAALQLRVRDAQAQAEQAKERVEQARQRLREAQAQIARAEEDVKSAQALAAQAARAAEGPRRQAEEARRNAAKAEEADAQAEQAAAEARRAAEEAVRKSAEARDAASAAQREEAEARRALTQASDMANTLQNCLTNLTNRKETSSAAMTACDAALAQCRAANITTQGLPDDDLVQVNASYEAVKKYHKDTVYQARLVREIRQYVDVGEKHLAAGQALL